MTKYIFITGGVVSGLGKGIAAASLGLLLKSRGLSVLNQKFDPYLNIDPGTLNPYEHGEVFVTDDGAETDLDLGHYERFTDVSLSQNSSTTAGRVYLAVLNKEREGGYNGKTVQVIPNVTDEIRHRLMLPETNADEKNPAPDVIITEVGGTVGDIESLPFMEAIRQIKNEVGFENCAYIHLTLLPYIEKTQELKTKPTQHSVKTLLGLGIQPDVIMLRSKMSIDPKTREKLAIFCNVSVDSVIQNLTADSIYEVPLMLEKEGLGNAICNALHIQCKKAKLTEWESMVDKLYNPQKTVKIALVGKYVALRDAYLSVAESLIHAGIFHNVGIEIDWVNSEELCDQKSVKNRLKDVSGIIVPGGFGNRGIEGMILTAQYAREHCVPYFGICLGMQIVVIEYARNVLKLAGANSGEMDKNTPYPVIDLMPDQEGKQLGGTLRLGKYECRIKKDSLAHAAYGKITVWERHRHRYEFNNAYREQFAQSTLHVSGINPERDLVEIVELDKSVHPWMVAGQFHPEFKSRPNKVHPLFKDFIGAALLNT
ncbi:MAG: CTP synthase [Spirochaetales bacterium]